MVGQYKTNKKRSTYCTLHIKYNTPSLSIVDVQVDAFPRLQEYTINPLKYRIAEPNLVVEVTIFYYYCYIFFIFIILLRYIRRRREERKKDNNKEDIDILIYINNKISIVVVINNNNNNNIVT